MGSQPLDTSYISHHIERTISIKKEILNDINLLYKLANVADLCVKSFERGNKILLAGNGGSAADAQHIAAEFVSRFKFDRPGLPSIALTTDTSILTAIGNDYGYEKLFSRQLQANGKLGDLFIALSTSGNSKNIIEAVRVAKDLGIKSVAFTGKTGGELKQYSDHTLCIPSESTALIQESHIMFGHIICGYVEDELFVEKN